MSSRRLPRFFVNPYPDYSKNVAFTIDKNYWSQYLSELAMYCVKKTKLNHDTCDGGLYTGSLGVAYMIEKVLSNGFCKDYEKDLVKYSHDCIATNDTYFGHGTTREDSASFILGNCGLYTIGSLVGKNLLKDESICSKYAQLFENATKICEKDKYLKCGCDELFVGRAGVLCAYLFYAQKLKIEVITEEHLFKILNAIVKSGRDYARKNRSPMPLMYAYYDTEYIGAAHGVSAILLMLLSFPKFLSNNPDIESDVRRCVDYLVSVQMESGNFPSSLDEIGHSRGPDELVHWCHGASGVVYCIAKAYLLWKDQKYLESCIKAGEICWEKGLIRKGPGICHGVAGNGYVHLLLYRLTNDEKYLYRALKFAEFLEDSTFKAEARRPDSPFSLYEGLAGTVCFLVDLVNNPKEAEFPFFNIFD